MATENPHEQTPDADAPLTAEALNRQCETDEGTMRRVLDALKDAA